MPLVRPPQSRRPSPSRSRLVCVAAYGRPIEAHLCRCRLEAEGIEAFVADEHIVSLQWLYSPAVGGVKVQVHQRDLERARRILEGVPAPPRHSARFVTDDLQAPRCPRCGSLEVEPHFARRVAFASSILFGFPLPILRRRARCRTCGKRWRPVAAG